MDSKKTGALISAIRKQKNMTQKDLADLLGVSNRAVSKWETGDGYPDISILPALAEVLNLSVDELLEGAAAKIPREATVSILEEYLLESTEKRFADRYLISLSIITAGIIASFLGLKLYNGYNYSSILYALIIAIAFLSIGLKFYLNTCKLIRSSEVKYNQIGKPSKSTYHRNFFKHHALFYSLYLILAEFLVFVAPLYPFVCYGYYRVKGTIFGHFDVPPGKLALDYQFCIIAWVALFFLLLTVGLVILKKQLSKTTQ